MSFGELKRQAVLHDGTRNLYNEKGSACQISYVGYKGRTDTGKYFVSKYMHVQFCTEPYADPSVKSVRVLVINYSFQDGG